jgi:hypothetical protein
VKRTSRAPAQLSASLHKRLSAYTLPASAAGVGVLALAQPAEARIVYTPAHIVIALHDSYKLDLNHDGIADFTILNTSYHNTSTWFYRLYEKAAEGNAVEASISHTFQQELAKGLIRGTRIPHHAFYPKAAMLASALFNPGGTFSDGNWVNVDGRYLALRFEINGRTHYGWARLNVTVHGTSVSGTLTGYAYETIPNKPIKAGQTHGKDEATLGHLATGASAIPVWRVKPTAATSH